MTRQYAVGDGTFVNDTSTRQYASPSFFINETTAAASGSPFVTLLQARVSQRAVRLNRYGPVNPVNINLIGQDKFYGQPGQPPPGMRWQTPARRIPRPRHQVNIRFLGLSSSVINLIYARATTFQTPTPYYRASGAWSIPTAVYVRKSGTWQQVYG